MGDDVPDAGAAACCVIVVLAIALSVMVCFTATNAKRAAMSPEIIVLIREVTCMTGRVVKGDLYWRTLVNATVDLTPGELVEIRGHVRQVGVANRSHIELTSTFDHYPGCENFTIRRAATPCYRIERGCSNILCYMMAFIMRLVAVLIV